MEQVLQTLTRRTQRAQRDTERAWDRNAPLVSERQIVPGRMGQFNRIGPQEWSSRNLLTQEAGPTGAGKFEAAVTHRDREGLKCVPVNGKVPL